MRLAGRLLAVAVAFGAAGFGIGRAAGDAATGARVAVVARKFDFSQTEIRARKGEPVTLVLSTTDFVHGFSLPDLGVRVDLIPGKPVVLTLRPDRAGRFVFLCDNFCGEDHDRMSGVLVVSDR